MLHHTLNHYNLLQVKHDEIFVLVVLLRQVKDQLQQIDYLYFSKLSFLNQLIMLIH